MTTILALNPDPTKEPTNVDKAKYDAVRTAMLTALSDEGQIPFKALSGAVEQRLPEDFDGSPGWWATTVKLDLEARGLVTRSGSPQIVHLAPLGYLATFETGPLAEQARTLVLDVLPEDETIEMLSLGHGTISYALGERVMKDAVCYIKPLTGSVNLGFHEGVNLPDPEGLLRGTGKKLRHVKLQKADDVAQPPLRTLIEAALAEYNARQ